MTPKELFKLLTEYPQPTRTEVLTELETLTRNYNRDYTTALLSDLEELLNDWKYSKVVARLEAEYNENVLEPYNKALHRAEYAMAMGCSEPIEWPEEPQPFCPPPPFPGCDDDSLIFVAPMYEYAVEGLKSKLVNDTSTGTEDSPEGWRLPEELDMDKARKYFARAIERGFILPISTGFEWVAIGRRGGNAQLGYFLSKIYAPPRPITALESIFGVAKLSTYIGNADLEVKRADVIRWRSEIDNIFLD